MRADEGSREAKARKQGEETHTDTGSEDRQGKGREPGTRPRRVRKGGRHSFFPGSSFSTPG